MIPNRLQYILEHFWNDRKCDQIRTLGARIYYQHISNNIRKHMGTSLKHIMFVNMGIKFLKMFDVC